MTPAEIEAEGGGQGLASERAAEKAIAVLKRAIDAAENSNQAGEDFVCAAAAGPELLTALEDFDNWFCGFNPDDQGSRMEGRKVVIRARAAIARARGQ